jgi:hypothetical protein
MIHGINPYGMAHLRRFTEENVDLNRNFWLQAPARHGNDAYERLADAIAPPSMTLWSEVRAWARLLWFRVMNGKTASQAAVQGGQYAHPTGLFFGGTSDTWSKVTLRSIARDYLSSVQRLVVIDVHTGLGAYGDAEIILNVPTTTPEYQRAVAMWSGERVRSTVKDRKESAAGSESVSAHLDASVKLAFTAMLPGVEVTAVSLEFGTVSPMKVFAALRAENWLHHHGGPDHPKAAEIKQRLLRAFHPDDAAWEGRVWSAGKRVVEKALARIGGIGKQAL